MRCVIILLVDHLERVQLVLDRHWFWTASFGQMCPTDELSTGHCRVPPKLTTAVCVARTLKKTSNRSPGAPTCLRRPWRRRPLPPPPLFKVLIVAAPVSNRGSNFVSKINYRPEALTLVYLVSRVMHEGMWANSQKVSIVFFLGGGLRMVKT